MKKFMKFCGVTALILLIIGLILWGVGSLYAGSDRMSEIVDKVTDGKVSFDLSGIRLQFDEVEDFLDKNAIVKIDDSSMFNKKYTIWKDNVEKTKVADDTVKELDVELGGSTFDIAVSEDECFYIEYSGYGKSQAYVEEGELYIKAMNNAEFKLSLGDNASKLTLYIPQGALFDEVSVELGAGQMKLDGLQTKDLEASIGAGQILAKELQAEKLDVSIGAGEIVLQETTLTEVSIEVGAGNCEMQGTIAGDVDVDCAMGNVTLALRGAQSEFNYEIQCVSGNITIGEKEYSGLAQEQSIANMAAKTMDLECAMGNLEVKFEE